MAARTFVRQDSNGHIKEFTSAEMTALVTYARLRYYTNQSVTLSRVAANGNLSPNMIDSRQIASGTTTHPTSYQTPGSLGSATVQYDTISQTVASTTQPTDTNNIAFPAYYSNGGIYACSWQDLSDTILQPALEQMDTSNEKPYSISTTSTAPTNYDLVGADAANSLVFRDTMADVSLYTSAGIPEALDQPTTYASYYLVKRETTATNTIELPSFVKNTSGAGVQQYTASNFETLITNAIRHYAASSSTGLRYEVTTNVTRTAAKYTLIGAMYDRKLNTGGTIGQKLINADDYRSQRFPTGSTFTTQNTYRLYMYRAIE